MALKLNIEIDKGSGFCFGVVNAIEIAEDILSRGDGLYCLGQIVHNDEEVARLEKKGMITMSMTQIEDLHDSNVLIRAHGEPPETYEQLRKNRNHVIDATCPIVLKLQERIKKSFDAGEYIMIFGKKDHPEVIGLQGQLEGRGLVFSSLDELLVSELPKEVTLYSQTTKDVDQLHNISKYLGEMGIEVKLKDTICRQVSSRREGLREFSRKHDVVIFVAGRNSSNGKVLYEVCKAVNPSVYFTPSVQSIDKNWFKPNQSVGICGATSTPKWLMQEMADYLAII